MHVICKYGVFLFMLWGKQVRQSFEAVAAHAAHGDADGSQLQRRRIIDAVPDAGSGFFNRPFFKTGAQLHDQGDFASVFKSVICFAFIMMPPSYLWGYGYSIKPDRYFVNIRNAFQ